jgi:hypothetical protein
VDESNLRFQVASLRKALGQDRDLIKTVSGRGYLFAAEGMFDDPAEELALPGSRSGAHLAIVRQGEVVAFPEPRPPMMDHAVQLALSESRETCEALRELLQSVLEELRRRTLQDAAPSTRA